MASQPALAQHLIDHDVHGRAFIDQIQEEDEEPLLFLPAGGES